VGGNRDRLKVFTGVGLGLALCCKGLKGYANVLRTVKPVVPFLGGFMKKLVAMVFFAALAGNAMAQAGGAAAGAAGGAGAGAGAVAGTVAVVAVGVAGVAAASSNSSNSANH
jgi:hypothetical protein